MWRTHRHACNKSMTKQHCVFAVTVLFAAFGVLAAPTRLTVQPKGTNQIELTLSPVITNVFYEVLARTKGPDGHWMTLAGYIGSSNDSISATCDLGGIQGLTLITLQHWTFVAGRWDDPLGDELPPMYKELVLRIDPFVSGDPYANLMGDGWVNIQKLQNNMDPFTWYTPPVPQLSVKFHGGTNNSRMGDAILTWQILYGTIPDYFLIARANRTMRPMTNDPYFARRPSGPRPGSFGTNRPPNVPMYRRPDPPREDPLVTGPYELAGRVPGRAGLRDYHYVETNVDTLFQPLYRVSAHYSPPLHARLDHVNAGAIRGTMLPVAVQQATNGYALT